MQAAARRFYNDLRDTYFGSGIHYAMCLSKFDLFKPWNSDKLLELGVNSSGNQWKSLEVITETILLLSPGEEFCINITTRDQLLNKIAAELTFSIRFQSLSIHDYYVRAVNFPSLVLHYSRRL